MDPNKELVTKADLAATESRMKTDLAAAESRILEDDESRSRGCREQDY
jgi:hypothetical protein